MDETKCDSIFDSLVGKKFFVNFFRNRLTLSKNVPFFMKRRGKYVGALLSQVYDLCTKFIPLHKG